MQPIERCSFTVDGCELRAEGNGRRMSGVALPFGVQAVDRRERFAAGAFDDLTGVDVVLGGGGHPAVDHPLARTGGGLELTVDTTALRFAAELPETRDADDALANVRAGIYRNVSVEFRALRARNLAGVREIQHAALVGIVVLPRGAYTETNVSVRGAHTMMTRRRMGAWL